jgi:hypothetical protein
MTGVTTTIVARIARVITGSATATMVHAIADDLDIKLEVSARATPTGRPGGRDRRALVPGQVLVAIQACGTLTPLNGCENLLYAPITTFRFYRGGRTDINIVQEGQIPVVPGASVLLSQDAAAAVADRLLQPALPPRQQRQQPRRDPDRVVPRRRAARHQALRQRDLQRDGTVIGDGLLPVPLAMGQHCCVGGNNRLRARIRHLGNNNQIENIRLFVHHGKGISAARRARWAGRATAAAARNGPVNRCVHRAECERTEYPVWTRSRLRARAFDGVTVVRRRAPTFRSGGRLDRGDARCAGRHPAGGAVGQGAGRRPVPPPHQRADHRPARPRRPLRAAERPAVQPRRQYRPTPDNTGSCSCARPIGCAC